MTEHIAFSSVQHTNLAASIKQGIRLASGAAHLLQGGFTMDKMRDAEQLYAGANSFFKSLKHMGQQQQEGLDDAGGNYRGEIPHRVIMYSGCRDDQTSADANISGAHVGVSSSSISLNEPVS
jgi:hypothetical protein